LRPRASRSRGAMAAATAQACEIMRADPIFNALLATITAEIVPGKERPALSHHTTTSCQVSHEGAPLVSLNRAGMDAPIDRPFPGAGVFAAPGKLIHLSAPSFLTDGDGIAVEYETAVWPTVAEAKRQACLEYMALLLGHEPDRVRLPPRCFRHGQESVDRARAAARQTRASRPPPGHGFDAWAMVASGNALAVSAGARFGPPPPPPRGPRQFNFCLLYTSPSPRD
jgi:hypothetical protein